MNFIFQIFKPMGHGMTCRPPNAKSAKNTQVTIDLFQLIVFQIKLIQCTGVI